MLDSIYHMTPTLLLNRILPRKRLDFATSKCAVVLDVIRLPDTTLYVNV